MNRQEAKKFNNFPQKSLILYVEEIYVLDSSSSSYSIHLLFIFQKSEMNTDELN